MENYNGDLNLGIRKEDIDNASIKLLSFFLGVFTEEYVNAVKSYFELGEWDRELNELVLYSRIIQSTLSEDDDLSEETSKIKVMIFTGSVLEAIMQFFLLVYQDDYNNTHWHQWETTQNKEMEYEVIKRRLISELDNLKTDGFINSEQRKHLKDTIHKEIKRRKVGCEIESIMLSDLIALFVNQSILNLKVKNDKEEEISEDFCEELSAVLGLSKEAISTVPIQDLEDDETQIIEKMKKIRDNRNKIHIFAKADETISENVVIESIKQLCYIMRDLSFRINCKVADAIK